MKKIIMIGAVGVGKTSLAQALLGIEEKYLKTQSVDVLNNCIIDTPGEFLERGSMNGALMVSSVEADIIVLVQSTKESKSMFPPCYAGAFSKEVIGVVTNLDISTKEEVDIARMRLNMAGATKIFLVDNITKKGIKELKNYLE